MNELNLQLSAYVKRERKRQKLTGAKIEAITEGAISPVTLSKLETGKTRWSMDHVAAIAYALGVDADVLLANALGRVRDNPAIQPELLPLLSAVSRQQWGFATIALGELIRDHQGG